MPRRERGSLQGAGQPFGGRETRSGRTHKSPPGPNISRQMAGRNGRRRGPAGGSRDAARGEQFFRNDHGRRSTAPRKGVTVHRPPVAWSGGFEDNPDPG